MIQESKSRLRILQLADDARKAKEAAMNELETYIYHVKNKLNDDENALKAVSTEEQRTNVLTVASQLADWLDEEGNKATVKEFKSKQNELKLQAEPIFKRYSEIKDRSTAVNNGSISFIFIACINILT
jgi:hypoxia up-regulated 1